MIDIEQAEETILQILPNARALQDNAIKTQGLFLVFHSLKMENADLGEVGYEFRLYVALQPFAATHRVAYGPLSKALQALVSHWQIHRTVALGSIKPHGSKGLLIYEIALFQRL